MSLYQIPSADLSQIPPGRREFLSEAMLRIYFENDLDRYSDERYYPWEKIKHLSYPEELESPEELWYVIR